MAGVLVPVIVRLDGLPQGWLLLSVMQGADDVIDTPTDVSSGVRSDLRVIVSNRGATVAGSVEDAAGRGVALRDVLLFPDVADVPEPWASGSHRALTDRQGRFHIDGIAPGHYLVLAADRPIPMPLDQDAWATIRESATSVALDEQSRSDVRLELVAWPY